MFLVNHVSINKRALTLLILLLLTAAMLSSRGVAVGQSNNAAQPAKKANERPAAPAKSPEPFDTASVEQMAGQCVTLDTEAGAIRLEVLPEAAPETVRNFLNLAAIGAFDTTTFSRVVKDFVIQGGNVATRQGITAELVARVTRKIPDEPNYVKHVRGVVSMARPEEPNSASSHFFILIGDAPNLDGKFAAFGRVVSGMDVADAINHAPAEGEKPEKPVRIKRAAVSPCVKGEKPAGATAPQF
jgi:peptidyl-prolyl cis-trans isomerase B (cyclophilin B)